MHKREVIAVTGPSVLNGTFPLTQLRQMSRSLKSAADQAYLRTFYRLWRIDYSFRNSVAADATLNEIIDAFYPSGDYNRLRTILCNAPVAVDFDPGQNHKNLIYSHGSQHFHWDKGPGDNIFARVHLPQERMAALVFDILLDISFANCQAIRPTVARYLSCNTKESLYKLKVEYLHEKSIALSDFYGALSKELDYVSFSAALRHDFDLVNPDHLAQVANLWDEFIKSKLIQYCSSSESILSDLREIPKVGKQLSCKLENKIRVETGPIYLVYPHSKLRYSDKVRAGLASSFGVGEWSPRHSFVLHDSDFATNPNLRTTLGKCVRDSYASVYRLYLRGDK